MSQIVKLRRSSVSGQKPTNSNLQLGELAINTTDGKVYMSKSGSIGPSIEELISTNAFNTGSVNISGSITLIGQEIITGCLVVTDGVGIINKGLISENSDLVLTSGSNIYVENGGIISGSQIWGDGSNLINIPFSGVTGLQLNKIISGSSEAVISPSGLNINTNVSITGSLNVTSITGSIDWSNIINGPVNEGSIGGFSTLYQTTDQSTWSFQHSIGQRYPIFQVFNNNGNVIIPTQIKTIDENNSEILFATPQRGVVVASLGGGNGSVQQFMSSSLWVVNHNLGTEFPNVEVWDNDKKIIIPNTIESINTNQIEISFDIPTSGYVSVARGGHIFSGSMAWDYIVNKPAGIVSSSQQLTGSYDSRYVLSGSITQTTWDNIANKPAGIISGSIQVDITGTTGYSTFSSSIATTDLTQNNRLDSLETESGSIRSNFNSFTSSYTTVSSSLDNRLDILEAYSGSQLVPSASMSFRTLQTDVYCKNMTGTQINKGTVVRIVGSVGDNPLIGVANPSTELTSANVLGIATENIPNDSFGLVITEGVLTGVNTNGMTAGALLYLGTGGIFTTISPVAPNHGVRLGEVLRVQQNQGSIYVRVDNGIELNEAHDVIYTGITHGDLLIRSGSVWKNGKSLNGNYVITGSLSITQNLTVFGSSSLVYVTSSQLAVSASFISVNVFEPAERFGGLKVYDSGSSNATASLLWDSFHNHWVYQNVSGSNYSGGMLLSGPRNTGSLGDEPTLINGVIPKSVGGDHLDNSIISESGNTITISGNLIINSLTGSVDFSSLINKPTLVSGSSQIDITGTTGYSTFSSSIATTTLDLSSSLSSSIGLLSSSIASIDGTQNSRLDSIESLTGSISSLNSFTSSINTTIKSKLDSDGVISGSLQIIYSGLTGVPSGIVSGSSQIIYSGLTGIPNNIVSGSDQLTGSYDSRYILSGSITETTWDNIANKPVGIISGSIQVDITGTTGYSTFSSSISSSIGYLSSSVATTTSELSSSVGSLSSSIASINNTQNGRLDSLETASGSIISDFNTFTSSYTTGSFTGSFKGDGTNLYNIPASGVTGLNLNKIISGSVSASISPDRGLEINTNVYIDGSLTAKELFVNYVTSSVLYESGSTKFGDTSDDNHLFTGSVLVDGKVNASSLTGSINFNNLTNVPTLVSGSSQLTGSFDTRYILSGSITETTWDNIANKPNGIVSGSFQIVDLGFLQTSSFNTYTSSNDEKVNSLINNTGSYATTSSLTSISQSIAATDLEQNNRLTSIEGVTGSFASTLSLNSYTLTSSFNTYTSSNDGKVNELINVTGSYATTGSNSFQGTQNITGSLDVTGTITALSASITYLETIYQTSSIIFSSGSNILGDESNDTQTLFGTVVLPNGPLVITGSVTSSLGFVGNLTGTASYATNALSASYAPSNELPDGVVSGSQQIINLGFLTTSSLTSLSASIASTDLGQNNRLGSLESITSSLQNQINQKLDTGSLNTYTSSNDGRVSSLESKTGSYLTTGSNIFIGIEQITGSLLVSGSVVISGSLDLSNANIGSSRYLHTQQTSSVTWNITHNLGYSYPNVTVYDGSTNKIMIPSDITSIDQNTTQVTFATSEYGFALVSVGGISIVGDSDRYLHTQNTSTGSWVIDHNLDYKFPNIDVYDSNDEQLIPQKVKAVSENRIQIDFVTPTSGNVIISTGGQRSTSLFNDNGSYYSTDNDIVITGSLVVTGDVDAANFNTTSDKKIKTNLEKVENALEKIEKINGYTFNWLESYNENQTRQIGMLANEVYDVQPELTTERKILINGNEETILLLDYSKVTALLIEAVKELNEKVIKLENKKKKK